MPDAVLAVITEKAVCIKKDADEREAMKLKEEFEALGAQIEFAPMAAPAAHEADRKGDDEFLAKLGERKDIFSVEQDPRFRNVNFVCIALGMALSMWITKHDPIKVASDFYDKVPPQVAARIITEAVHVGDLSPKKPDPPRDNLKTDIKTMKPSPHKGAGGTTGGGGDPRARVTQKGVLGIISGKVTGRAIASADIFGKGGFATDIDGILQGVGGLKSGGSGGVGRRGEAGIGFGAGYGSGFGGGGGSVEDILGSLLGGGGSSLGLKQPTHRGVLAIHEPNVLKSGTVLGGRSRMSIMRVVMQNLAALRYAYNKRLREKPGLRGKITCKFAIDEFGKVVYCEVVGSTMADPQLEGEVADKVKRWAFEKIDKVGDITEVVYPFAFSQ
jgi:hypothetical protein